MGTISSLHPAVFYALISALVLSMFVPDSSPAATNSPAHDTPVPRRIVMVIHGGAGTIRRSSMTPEREKKYRDALAKALRTGYKVLAGGGASVDAVEAAIRTMEDSPLFNAGRGAVFTHEGKNEMDASIMVGDTRNAGAVASVSNIRNPITAARRVLDSSRHVMLVGEGAMHFAHEQGLRFEPDSYFFTQERWDRLQKAKAADESQSGMLPYLSGDKFGTVGAVALDAKGTIAAGTSTGGLTDKQWGRVGDSPIVGAGTYADNRTCGVSSTGTGEYYMRGVLAYRVSALMELAGVSLHDAVHRVIHEDLVAIGGTNTGGMIALDAAGNVVMDFNTAGMYRGYIRADGEPHTYLYDEGD